ncbi:MAG TPA: DUF4230 domain-containing protein [Allosphingosinicella sp.]|jgi:hypothetical protein|uniref:DUF4230 domain-containing protein n=1 Tax=Allosphingosinicella sp. TaxID=2823234 RepID=UPI002F27CB56
MDARWLKLAAACCAALLAGVLLAYAFIPRPEPKPLDVRAIADAALLSVRDEGRLVSFTARFASVVTASEERLGLSARKTLIMPGTVRYSVDLARLKRGNLAWDDKSQTLTVTLPPLEVSWPSINLNEVQEYSEGGILMALTGTERELDQANQRSAQDELMRQARAPAQMQLARSAAMRIIARSFAIPLRTGGIDASVVVRFVDPSGREAATFLERSRRVNDSLRDRRAGSK